MQNKVYNYSAGPAVLPQEVLAKIQTEIFNYEGMGMSVMEISHRSKPCIALFDETEALLRKLMGISEQYSVLFMQGGARLQFAAVPLNLFGQNRKADYIHTGSWTKYAIAEANKAGQAVIVASGEEDGFRKIPDLSELKVSGDADYIYLCTNNTIEGTAIRPTQIPVTPLPLVADMSSNILSEEYDVEQFGLIFAGAQKNMGIAGVTVVVIRNDLLERSPKNIADMLNYKLMHSKQSMLNTPPVFAVYVLNKVLKWVEENGGVAQMAVRNKEKAALLYDFIDNSSLYQNNIEDSDRSLMNVIFNLSDAEEDARFAKEAEKNGLMFLKGHRDVGGIRASIYNAAPIEQVQALIEFMKKYEAGR